MKKINYIPALLLVLTLLFSLGLIFATLELPHLLDRWIQSTFHFPSFDQEASTFHMSKARLYTEHFQLRIIGYISLALILALILFGLVTERVRLSALGAVLLFLPVFGHFTATMFFLAGLGFLRFLWIPFTEISPLLMQLGDIILLPHTWLVQLGRLLHLDLHMGIAVFFIASGVLLFVFGVYVWMRTRFQRGHVAVSWIYRISRHPQYLGWILWSYGLFLIPVEAQKRTWSYPDSLPLLLSIMIILAISLFEEKRMEHKYGREYTTFRNRTAFMFPLPGVIKKLLKSPLRLFYRSDRINSTGRILVFTGFYTAILMLGSWIYLSFTSPASPNSLTLSKRLEQVEAYVADLERAENRRARDLAAMHLSGYGELALEPLLDLLQTSDQETSVFIVRTLGEIGSPLACRDVHKAWSEGRVPTGFELYRAMGELQCTSFEKEAIKEIRDPGSAVKSYAAWYLGEIASKEAVEPFIEDYQWLEAYKQEAHKQEAHTQAAYLEALGKIGDSRAVPLLIEALESENLQILEASMVALGQLEAEEARATLEELKHNENWEVRVYARAVLKQISSKKERIAGLRP